MFRPTVAVLGALAASAPSPAPADVLASLEAEQRALFEQAAPAVVVISNDAAISAGFFAAPGLVVTSAHGVLGAREPQVTLCDGRTVRGEVVSSSPRGLDLALVRVPAAGPARVLAPSRDAPLRAGDVVVAIGHGDGARWSLSTGIVSNPRADGPDGSLVRLQLGLRPGASGSPVVDRAGNLVGVVVQGDPGTLAFAIRADATWNAFPELAELATPLPLGDAPVTSGQLEQEEPAPRTAPELIVGPADPRPAPARVARVSAVHAKRAPELELPRRETAIRRAPPPAVFADDGALRSELAPAALLVAGALVLASFVFGGMVVAGALAGAPAAGRRVHHRRVRLERRLIGRAARHG